MPNREVGGDHTSRHRQQLDSKKMPTRSRRCDRNSRKGSAVTPLKIRFGLELVVLALAVWFDYSNWMICIVIGSVCLTVFVFHVRVNATMMLAEDYRAAIVRMEHSQSVYMADGIEKATEAHQRWAQIMDQAEKQMQGPDDDIMGFIEEEGDDDEDE